MSKIYLPILFSVICCLGCSRFIGDINEPEFDLQTKGVLPEENYVVTTQDIRMLLPKATSIVDIKSFPSIGNPLLYVVECDPGFWIISGDKRACPIIAYSEDGTIEPNTDVEKYIMDEFSAPILSIKQSMVISKEMAQNIETWNRIEAETVTFDSSVAGNYYYRAENEFLFRDLSIVGPLLVTNWGQANHYSNDHYWNEYCPWSYSSCTGPRAPVGCVAVAGGQFAYYMKDRPGVAVRIPVEAVCRGYVGHYNQYFQGSLSIGMIDEMPLNYWSISPGEIEHARIFLAYIGNQIGMIYGPTSSGASTSSLPSLFDVWGIDTDYVAFADSLAIAQIESYDPVVTRGSDYYGAGGHSWIIDGYKESLVSLRSYYYLSTDSLTENERSCLTKEDCDGYMDYEPMLDQKYHMNWGWNGSYDGWYSISNWSVAGYDFSVGKHMIKTN